MANKLKIILITVMILLLLALAGAWTYTKVGNTFLVTLDSGHRLNITSYNYDPSTKNLQLTIKAIDRLTIGDMVQIANITQSFQDAQDKKKNLYIQTKIIQ